MKMLFTSDKFGGLVEQQYCPVSGLSKRNKIFHVRRKKRCNIRWFGFR